MASQTGLEDAVRALKLAFDKPVEGERKRAREDDQAGEAEAAEAEAAEVE
jgi:hypothetical protein